MLEFRVLGPLEALADGNPLPLGGRRPRLVLAVLLLEADRPVGTDRLVEAVWRDEPPASVRAQIAIHISALRKALGVHAHVIETVPGGYRLNADAVRIDVREAERLIADGRRARDPQPIRRALGMWRGVVLDGLDTPGTRQLEELRLTTAEEWAELELEAGDPEAVIGEFRSLVAAHPFRERLRAQLMAALHRAGRTSNALGVYEEGKNLLIEELGLEPGPELRQLHERIASGRSADGSPAAPVPAELPGDLATFTGRDAEVERLCALLTGDRGGVVAISGPGGIGKSALAIHVAHRVSEHFPDGQLYVNLHGATPDTKPLGPAEALARFLRALGVVTADIPTDEEEAAARFRSVTHGKRLLVVLDNVADAARLRPLLPGSRSCGVLITSRRVLSSVDGVRHEPLDVLPADEAARLLTRLAGAGRLRSEPDAVADVVRLCGRLPLALSIAGARLIARPGWTVRSLADRLAVEQRRLAELTADDQAVRGSFRVSYEELDDPGAARLFRLFGLLEGTDMSLAVAAALADRSEDRTAALLDQLVDTQLVEVDTPGRYRMHDLLRLFARELAEAEEPPEERAAAVRRGLHCYLATACNALLAVDPKVRWRIEFLPPRLAHPGIRLSSMPEIDGWFAAETRNIVAAARQALAEDDPAVAAGFSICLDIPVERRTDWWDGIALAEVTLEAARSTGDARYYGFGHNGLGWTMHALGRRADSLEHFDLALEAWRSIGHEAGEAITLHGRGAALRALERYEESLNSLERARTLWRRQDYQRREGACLTGMGLTLQRLGRYDEAIAAHEEAAALAREGGVVLTEVMSLGNLGEAHRLAGHLEEAAATFREALRLGREEGYSDTYWAAEHLWGLGRTVGDHSCQRRAAAILHGHGLITYAELREIETNSDPGTPQVIADQL